MPQLRMSRHEELSESVMRGLRRGDEVAFGRLVSRYGGPVLNYLYRIVGRAGIAEDLLQDCFLRAYQKADTLRPGAAVAPWLFTIARNLAVDQLRHTGRRPVRHVPMGGDEDVAQPVSRDIGPQGMAEDLEQRQRVEAVLAELPTNYREVLSLITMEGFKYREVSEILGVPEKTVCTWLLRAKKRFHEIYSRKGRTDE